MFRAKTTTTNEWVYGEYAFAAGYHVIFEDGKPYIIQHSTLDRCTGLYDKNQVQLLENDICEDKNGYAFVIAWSEDFDTWAYLYYLRDCRDYPMDKFEGEYSKVGTYHENSELVMYDKH